MGKLVWFGAPAFIAAIGLAPFQALILGGIIIVGSASAVGYVVGQQR